MNSGKNWQRSDSQTFWQEEGACSHVVQIYDNDEEFLDLLEGFVANGLKAGEAVVLVGTEAHLSALEMRLKLLDLDLAALKLQEQYLPFKAEEMLPKFMVNDWPDYSRFMQLASEMLSIARKIDRKVRVFGEMVALLWEQGKTGATIMLEQLWNMYCEKEPATLLCAYPKSAFPEGSNVSIQNICKHHTKRITSDANSKNELLYLDLSQLN